jgi:glycosyltransferase involved in cell wall biosynthesis
MLLLRLGPRATVLGGTDPPFTAAILGLLSCIRRLEYQCILLDAYPDGLVALARLQDGAAMTRIWRALNRLAYGRAQELLVIGRDMTDLLWKHYGVDGRRVTYMPLWATAEVEAGGQGSRETLLEPRGLAGKFVVQYSGNMGLWHDMETIVQAAACLQDEPDIHFLLIGKGMRRSGAEETARRLGVRNITWLDFVPRERLPETLAACDAALISFRAGLEGVAVPSKLYGILASGRPVVAQVPAASEVARVVTEEGCGVVVPPGDAAALADAVRALAEDVAGTRVMARRAREAYLARYTIDHAVERFSTLWEIA